MACGWPAREGYAGGYASSALAPSGFFLLPLRIIYIVAKMRKRPARPPITPPAIAPVLFLDVCGEEVGVGNDGVDPAAGDVVTPAATVAGVETGSDDGDVTVEELVVVVVGLAFWVVPSLRKTPRPSLQQLKPREPSPQQ